VCHRTARMTWLETFRNGVMTGMPGLITETHPHLTQWDHQPETIMLGEEGVGAVCLRIFSVLAEPKISRVVVLAIPDSAAHV